MNMFYFGCYKFPVSNDKRYQTNRCKHNFSKDTARNSMIFFRSMWYKCKSSSLFVLAYAGTILSGSSTTNCSLFVGRFELKVISNTINSTNKSQKKKTNRDPVTNLQTELCPADFWLKAYYRNVDIVFSSNSSSSSSSSVGTEPLVSECFLGTVKICCLQPIDLNNPLMEGLLSFFLNLQIIFSANFSKFSIATESW